MDMKETLLQWFRDVSVKKLKGSGIKSKVANTATPVRPALMTI